MGNRVKRQPLWIRRTAVGCAVLMTAYLYRPALSLGASGRQDLPPAPLAPPTPRSETSGSEPPPLQPGELVAARIGPTALSVARGGATTAGAWALFDEDAASMFAPEGPVRLAVDLGRPTQVDGVGFYGRAGGKITVLVQQPGAAAPTALISEVDLRELPLRWNRVRASAPVTTDRLFVEWTPDRLGGGLRELEIWGRRPDVIPSATGRQDLADRLVTQLVPGALEARAVPQVQTISSPVVGLGGSATFHVNLDQDGRSFARAFLVYELSGLPHWSAARRRINGRTAQGGFHAVPAPGGVQVEEIAPAWLSRGANLIEFLPSDLFDPAGYKVKGLRIVGIPADVDAGRDMLATDRAPAALVDGDRRTGLAGTAAKTASARGIIDLPLRTAAQLDSVWLRVDRPLTGALSLLPVAAGAPIEGAAVTVAGNQLTAGWNRVPFEGSTPRTEGVRIRWQRAQEGGGSITEVRVAASPIPDGGRERLRITYPRHGECVDHQAHIRGFLTAPGGVPGPGATLSLNGAPVFGAVAADGAFSATVPEAASGRPPGQPWQVQVQATYPDGRRVGALVAVDSCVGPPPVAQDDQQKNRPRRPVEDQGAPFGQVVRAGQAATLAFEGLQLDIPADALDTDVRITVRPLPTDQVAALDEGMVNVTTSARAFRLGPHGLSFKKAVRLTVPYDPDRFASGTSEQDMGAYFFDQEIGHWRQVRTVRGDADHALLAAETTHFTDFIAATLTSPDHPMADSFNPNSIKDVKLGDPAAGVDLIQPPAASADGAAHLSYPLQVPPGRQGMRPDLRLAYNSDSGNGWLGMGWDIAVPKIQVDTRFGVPRYDPQKETESYLLNGAQLVPLDDARDPAQQRLNPANRVAERQFVRRVEGGFETVVRHGTSPLSNGTGTAYSWEITDKHGKHFIYGDPAGSSGTSILSAPNGGGIAEWRLRAETDTFGNRVAYGYTVECGTLPGSSQLWTQIYPATIDYTSNGTLPAIYHVRFFLDDAPQPVRPDVFTSARAGFLTRTAHLLQHVRVSTDVGAPDTEIRTYDFEYIEGEFKKKLLRAVAVTHFTPVIVSQRGADDTEGESSFFASLIPSLLGRSRCGGGIFGALGLVTCPALTIPHPPTDLAGSRNEFYRHTFEYFRRTEEIPVPHGFGPLTAWGSINQNDGLSRTDDLSAGLNAFAGVGPTSCYPHAGLGGGFNIGDESTSRTFTDVNGDGIPDAVASSGSAFFGKRDSGYQAGTVSGLGDMGHSSTTTATLLGAIHFFGELGSGGVDMTWTNNTSDRQLLDIDGDGLPDLVRGGGTFSVAKNNFGQFAANPAFAGFQVNRSFVSTDIQNQIRNQHPPVGTVVAWTAPYFGQVQIGGGIQRLVSGGDGVQATIYRFHPSQVPADPANLSTVWNRTFAAADSAPCDPRAGNVCGSGAVLTATVDAGDKLFFNTNPIDDIDSDALAWDPQVAYSALCQANPGQQPTCTAIPAANLTQVEAYGPPTFAFSQLSDFRLAGPPEQPWFTTILGTVNVDISGVFQKTAPTADDVVVEVIQRDGVTGASTVRFSQAFPAASLVAGQPINLTLPVTGTAPNDQSGSGGAQPSLHADSISFRVRSDTPVDPAAFTWAPELRYQTYCRRNPDTNQDVCGAVSCPTGAATCTMSGDPMADHPLDRNAVVFSPEVDRTAYGVLPSVVVPQTSPPLFSRDAPTTVFIAPQTGSFTVSGPLQQSPVTGGTIASWGNTVVTVQTQNGLLAKQQVAATATFATVTFANLSVTAGTPLYFTVWVKGTAVASWSPQLTFQSGQVFAAAASMHRLLPSGPAAAAPPIAMSGGYHQWTLGQWQTTAAFNPQQIRLVDNSQSGAAPLFTAVRPQHLGLASDPAKGVAGISQPAWAANGVDLYIAAGRVKPSRVGANAATLIARGNGGGLRKGSGTNSGLSLTLIGSFANSSGDSGSDLELLDLNGDGYPDSFDDAAVRWNNGLTGFGLSTSLPGLGRFRNIHTENVRYGFAFGSSASALANALHASGTVASVVSVLPSFGKTYGRSITSQDLVDVNGDGLPDRVERRSGSPNALVVRLNVGYGFGPEIAWPTPNWMAAPPVPGEVPLDKVAVGDDDQNAISMQDNVSNSLQVGYAGLGAGIAQSAGRSYVEPMDVNGDGLTDQVMKLPNERFLRVKINLGERFAPEEQWTMPGFTTTTGSSITLENPLTLGFGSNDALGFNENRSYNAGVGIPPITVPLLFVCLIFELSAQAQFGRGFSQMTMQDVNGDGAPDQVLKKDGDANVYVKLNLVGARHYNLLKTVINPLGGNFSVDYARQGNVVNTATGVDMPHNRWVLSQVVTDNGFLDDQRDAQLTTFDYQNSGFYSRAEREDLGFSRVITTRPDRSFLDETFHTDFYRHGLRNKVIEKTNGGLLFRKVETTWESRAAHGAGIASFFPADTRQTTSFYEGQTTNEAAPGKTWVVTRDYDANGNLKTFTDTGDQETTDDVTYTVTYQPDIITSAHIFKANLVEGRDGGGALLRRRSATYDGRGALKTLTDLMAGGKSAESGGAQNVSLTSTFNFDAVGNLHDVTNPAGHKVTYGYDSTTQIYQTSITDNTFGYVSSSTPNFKFGAVASTTDVNQQTERFDYDEFGRIGVVTGPADIGSIHSTINFEYGLGYSKVTFPFWAVTHHFDVQHPGDPLDTALFIDGLARPVQTKKDAVIDDAGTGQGVAGHTISGRVIYTQRGQIFRQGQPQSESGAAAPTIKQYTKVPMVNQTTYGYDILGRTRGILAPDAKGNVFDSDGNRVAVTTIDYNFALLDGINRLTRQVEDPRGKRRTSLMNVREDIVGVREQNTLVVGGPLVVLTTRYVQDPLSQVTRVTDQNGNVVSGEFDTVGHLVALTSPDAGRTEYRYDALGRLGAKQTANLAAAAKLTRYTYTTDRLATVDFPTSVDVVYTYGDSSEVGPSKGNVAGRVKQVTDESGTETRSYDTLGNVAQMVKTPTPLASTVPRPSYTMNYSYDQLGRVQQMKYPDGEVVSYQYDLGGLVAGASGEGPRGVSSYVSSLTYDSFGQRRRLALGNGVSTSYSYDATTRRLKELKTERGAVVQQDLIYSYDLVGNVNSLVNQIPIPAPVAPNTVIAPGPTSYSFTYDDLYQLTGATGKYDGCACGCNNQRQYTVATTYDAIGNITKKTQKDIILWPSGRIDTQAATTYDVNYSYSATRPHAPTAVGAQTLTYDADGNLKTSTGTFGPARTVTWNEEDRVQTEVDRGFTNSYLYNAEGVRTHKRRTSLETVYVNPYYVIRLGTLQTKHIMLGETRVASTMASLTRYGDPSTAGGSTFFYYHPDHLQSTNYTSNLSGQILQHDEYFPSGEVWFEERLNVDSRNAQPYLFNAKELDETGLYYYGARYYDPRQSQWISPDPMLGDYLHGRPNGGAFFPSNLGLYGYTWNNPVVLRDPDGNAVNLLAALVGAGAGALVGGAVYGAKTLISGESFSGRAFGASVAGGAVTGGLAGLTLGGSLAVQAAGAAAAGVAGGVTSRGIETGSASAALDPKAMAVDAAAGLVGFGVAKGVAAGAAAMTGSRAASSAATTEVTEGIYEFTAASGKTYVGQSGNIPQRLAAHARSGKLPPGGAVTRTAVPGGKLSREIAEQTRIDELGGISVLENKVNPIGPARQHLMPPPSSGQ